MDANKNGQIDPEEMSDRSRPFLEQAAQRAGLDPKKPIPISKLVEAPSGGESGQPGGTPGTPPPGPPESSSDGDRRDRGDRGNERSDRDRDRDRDRSRDESRSSSSGSSSSSKTPTVPGFGSDTKLPKAVGFDAPSPSASAANAAFAQKYDRRVIEMLDGMLKEYDRNRDDILDEEEMKKMNWRSDPKESDINKDGKLSRTELADRLAKRFQAERGPASGGSSASPAGGSNQQSEEYQRVKKYAESLLKQNDSNSNGLLEKNEWSEVKSITKDTDTNNDGIVTLDELVAKLSSFGKSSGSTASSGSASPSSSPSSSSPSPGSGPGGSRYGSGGPSRYGSSASTSKPGDRKTYRALSPLERLPKGLPDWFARNDADGDGQVHMSEYTTSWTDAKAEEFTKLDLNGDGFITSFECLKVEPIKK